MKTTFLILTILISSAMMAQQNRIKLGFLGFPSQSGFGIGNIGYERLDKSQKRSWQILYSMSGGSVALDAETYKRKWITVERLFYFTTISKKLAYYYTVFIETGERTSDPGHIAIYDTSRYEGFRAFELSPGAGMGLKFNFSKKLALETGAGPKLVWLKGTKEYYNHRDNIHFNTPYQETRLGFRFLFSFSWQF